MIFGAPLHSRYWHCIQWYKATKSPIWSGILRIEGLCLSWVDINNGLKCHLNSCIWIEYEKRSFTDCMELNWTHEQKYKIPNGIPFNDIDNFSLCYPGYCIGMIMNWSCVGVSGMPYECLQTFLYLFSLSWDSFNDFGHNTKRNFNRLFVIGYMYNISRKYWIGNWLI